jgi:hypothetical protein
MRITALFYVLGVSVLELKLIFEKLKVEKTGEKLKWLLLVYIIH